VSQGRDAKENLAAPVEGENSKAAALPMLTIGTWNFMARTRNPRMQAPQSTAAGRQPKSSPAATSCARTKASGDLDRLPMLTWILFLKFLDDMERVREEEA
jgi:hypothetical protein